MASCAQCQTHILFGGYREAGLRFCSRKCAEKGQLLSLARSVPEDLLEAQAESIHLSDCPFCNRSGPLDLQRSYRIWSAVFVSSVTTQVQISCRACGNRRRLADALFCLFLGWWSVPEGILLTPVQIVCNLWEICASARRDQSRPSEQLKGQIRLDLATRFLAEQNQSAGQPH